MSADFDQQFAVQGIEVVVQLMEYTTLTENSQGPAPTKSINVL